MLRNPLLHRYWFEFELRAAPAHGDVAPPRWLPLGCGVTAYDVDDAVQLLRERMFREMEVPAIATIIEDVDVSTLDARSRFIRLYMAPPIWRGVWFPNLLEPFGRAYRRRELLSQPE